MNTIKTDTKLRKWERRKRYWPIPAVWLSGNSETFPCTEACAHFALEAWPVKKTKKKTKHGSTEICGSKHESPNLKRDSVFITVWNYGNGQMHAGQLVHQTFFQGFVGTLS